MSEILLNSLDILTFVVPPILPAALTANNAFAQRRLGRDHLLFFLRNFVTLQIFQPRTAQLGKIDCQAVLLLVEMCVERRTVVRQTARRKPNGLDFRKQGYFLPPFQTHSTLRWCRHCRL